MRLLSRLAGPAGFALAALFFLFPFMAVSCDAPQLGGSVEISYTGAVLATGGDPTVSTVGSFGRESGEPVAGDEDAPDPDVVPLALVTLLITIAGLVLSLLPAARIRRLGALGAAALGGVMLVVTQIVAHSNLVSLLQESARRDAAGLGDDSFELTEDLAEQMVQTRFGFWLTLAVLVLVLLFSVAMEVRERMRQ